MSDSKRCKSCGNPVDLEAAQAHDGACPWCLAAFTFSPEPVGNPVTSSKKTPIRFGKYVKTEKLGAGGMGEVWKALDTELNRWVALKFLKDDDPSSTARFQREARTAAGLTHPGIASIHEVGEVDGRHFIAMQYIQGRTMAHFPRKDLRLIVRLLRDGARALEHAHRHGVIHRDLKPDNLMVEEREDGWHVVILDFGLARPIEGGEKLSKSGEVYGTAAYMSPEQARGEPLDERADVYSLGATLYEVLTGRPPFRGANLLELLRKVGAEEPFKPRKANPRIHRDLETIILKCLEKDRERRYANSHELADDLERFLNSDPILARPPSTLYRLRLHLGKKKAIAAAVIIAVAAVATIAGLWTLHWKPQQEQARLFREGMAIREEMLRLSLAPKVDGRRLKRRAAEARSIFEQANACVETPEGHVMRGRSLYMEGKPEEALAAFERAHELRLEDGDAKVELARALLMKYRSLRGLHMSLLYRDRGRLSHEVRNDPESEAARKVRERAERLLEERSVPAEKRDLLQGLLAFGRGEFREAADFLGRYNKVDGLDTQALMLEGHSRFSGQDLAGFIVVCARLAALAPDSVDYMSLGRARHQTGDVKGAIEEFTRALSLDPKLVEAYESRGFSRSSLGDHKGAFADFDKAVELAPNDESGYTRRAYERFELGDVEGAMKDYDHAVRLNPRSSAAFIERGGTRLVLEDYEGAIADCNEGLRLDPTQHAGYHSRGRARQKREDFRGALEDFTEGLKYDPDSPTLYFDLGEVRLILKETAAGEDDLAKAVEFAPVKASAYYTRGNIRYETGNLDGALADFTRALEFDSNVADIHKGLGRVHYDRGQFDKAEAAFTKAVELKPDHIDALHLRGDIRGERGDVKGALDDWTKALEATPTKQKLLRDHMEQHLSDVKEYGNRWGEYLESKRSFEVAFKLTREKEYDRALELYRAIVASVPKSERGRIAVYNVACVYALMDQPDPALDWLEKAVDMGFRDLALVKKDPDMDSLRGQPRFLKVLDRLTPK